MLDHSKDDDGDDDDVDRRNEMEHTRDVQPGHADVDDDHAKAE